VDEGFVTVGSIRRFRFFELVAYERIPSRIIIESLVRLFDHPDIGEDLEGANISLHLVDKNGC